MYYRHQNSSLRSFQTCLYPSPALVLYVVCELNTHKVFSLASSTIPPLAPRVSSVFSPSRFYLLPPLPSILSMALHSVRELSVGALPRGDWMILVVRIHVLPIFICSPSAKPGAHTICSVISIPLTERVSKMNQITALMKMSASL